MSHEDYCNLDVYDERIGCFRKTKPRYPDEATAIKAAKLPGKYRISKSCNGVRTELEPFEVK